ncbi:MAG: arsenical resistance protein ArsH [Candidatus Binataceae bacterium]
MRKIAIPIQSSVANEAGRMRPSPYFDRLVDAMEDVMKFTYLTRGTSDFLTNRYSERKEKAEELSAQAGLKAV